MKKWLFVMLCLLPVTASLAQDKPLQVVATTTIIADVAQNVGGDLVQVTALVPPDADVHAYQPSPSDAVLVSQADVVLVNGAGLEAFLGDLVQNAASVNLTVVSNGIRILAFGDHAETDGGMAAMPGMDMTDMSNASVSAAYMTISNTGTTDDRLVSITTDAAAKTEIHETTVDNDMAGMHMLDDGLAVPAGSTVALAPVGLHVMLVDIQRDLYLDDTVDLTLTFASGTSITVTAPVTDTPPAEITSVDANGLTVSGAWVRPAVATPGSSANYVGTLGVDADCGDMLAAHEGDTEEGPCDPHVWTDPASVSIWTDNIAAAFVQADPAHADTYQANAEAYKAQLTALDAEVEQILAVVPPEKRVLVTNHDFLNYFATRYGFRIAGVVLPGGTTLAEPDPQALAGLITTIQNENVAAIFLEASDPGRLAQVVAGEIGREIAVPALYSDSLSAPGTDGATYLDYVRHNAQVIADALAGK